MTILYKNANKKFNGQCQETVCTVRLSDMVVDFSLLVEVWLKAQSERNE